MQGAADAAADVLQEVVEMIPVLMQIFQTEAKAHD